MLVWSKANAEIKTYLLHKGLRLAISSLNWNTLLVFLKLFVEKTSVVDFYREIAIALAV